MYFAVDYDIVDYINTLRLDTTFTWANSRFAVYNQKKGIPTVNDAALTSDFTVLGDMTLRDTEAGSGSDSVLVKASDGKVKVVAQSDISGGGGGGSGDVISNESSNIDGQLALFGTQTDGKHIKKSSLTGLLAASSGVVSAATTSADIASNISDEVGSASGGLLVFNNSPTFQNFIVSPQINGSSSASGTLTLKGTSHATPGKLLFGTSAYDEANNYLGINTASPAGRFKSGCNRSYPC
jgi:hypothetical protein